MGPDKKPIYRLDSAYLYLTSGCNLRCSHCWLTPNFVPKIEEAPDGITADDVRKIIKEGRPMGLCNIKLTGGEPFINREVFEIIEVISSEELVLDIETNGTLIDEKAANFLKEHNASTVSVSIDSFGPAFHDAFRGVEGAWEDAVRGVECMVSERLNVQIIMSLVGDNCGDIEGIVEMAKRLKANSVKFNPVMPIGRGGGLTDGGKTLPVDELIRLSSWVEEDLREKYGVKTYFTIPSAFKKIGSFFKGNNAQCHILNIIGIIASGHISICGIGKEEPELVIGNIREDDLAEVWKNSPILAELREIVPNGMKGICGKCVFKNICLGACRANAYVLYRDLSAPERICQEAYEMGLFPETRII
jgi:SynChlorMet cassette radical SAM/SPASM protein ScmF